MFITEEDYKVVIGDNALKVISQVSPENRTNAEAEAREEIAGYLRPKYDCTAIFSAQDEHRNRLIVMYTCDISLYHMSAAMPQKMGHCHVHLRHFTLPHECSHAAKDGKRDTQGTV